ncbi:MAG TPA: HD domain-containing phosphohydrolase [Solirubrobacterales bacterium]|nr:HD domain-containing phosphohydrolase [Solirubrobacterales bacterium]
MVAVVDVFDALLSDRCYRPAFSCEEAVATIEEGRGTHFDPAVVDILLANLDDALTIRG